ncbi:MAG TPA: protein kinase [bacterium]|nr:protein kinase [bacterium]
MAKIDGKYKVLKKLGEGFSGCVYLAEADGRKVALKQMVLDQGDLSAEETLENFKREFRTLTKLGHPHIVRILDFGYDSKEKFYYFTTEYIDGPDIFEATRKAAPERIEEFFVQILRALSYLHSQGVYHFDIKPENILVSRDEGAKLIDFGLTAFRAKGMLVGSPAYMAPESLVAAERRDGRVDLYSLGVTWYQCLTGKNPFQAEDSRKTLELQKMWAAPAVSSQSSEAPAYLDPVLEKILRKNPAERYHRADQVIRDLNWSGRRKYPLETEATALAYLPGEGRLVGRDNEWRTLVSVFDRIFVTQSELKGGALLSGAAGTGKTRLLKEFRYHAQLHAVPVHDLSQVSPGDLKGPAILVKDDADEADVIAAEHWMRQLQRHPFLIVLAGSVPAKPGGGLLAIPVGDFSKPHVGQFAASVLGVAEPPETLVDELFARSSGNPLILTELLHALIRSHQIFDDQGRWSPGMVRDLGVDFDKLQVPKTLNDFCKAKYGRLSPEARRALEVVALAGAPLERARVSKLAEISESGAWDLLKEEGLVDAEPGGTARLLNPSFREWIARRTDSERLAKLHQALGEEFLMETGNDEAAHFHLGFGTSDAAERQRHRMAYGDAMAARHRWLEAADAYGDGARLAPDPVRRVDGALKQVRALFRAGRSAEALKILEETREALKKERANPDRWRWVQQTFREMASVFLKEGRWSLARESLQASQTLLEEHEEENPEGVEEMILANFKASLLMREGRVADALKISEETEARWRTLSEDAKKKVLNNELASIRLALGQFEDARRLFEEQAAYFERIGHLTKRAYAYYGWAESCYFLKNFPDAVRLYKVCIDAARDLKNEEILLHAFNGLGNIAYRQKDWDQAAENYQNALELAQHQANLDVSVAVAVNLAIVYRIQGDRGRALLYLKNVIDTLESQVPPSLSQLQFLTQGYLELGKVELENGDAVESRDAYRDAARLVRRHAALERFRAPALLGLAQACADLGRSEEARSALVDLEKGMMNEAERKEFEALRRRIPKA